ncbi:S8 family serine peptidase [Actinophytocola gossypii]|uniref:S8 family serine peptidase n=1 Tax=Actinophytocola gossypii TaxID=2812003 RepID=A0ABT2JG61_9PSEU|nr:S8 family serine peptidase [Actinophytocola gossypii]MCT2586269.1 S8 family serine peptidase [Actinophytocola gossypii]
MIHARARARYAGLLAGVIAAATASTAVLTGGPAGAAPAPGESGAPRGTATTVTLVTGDVVTLGGPRGVDVTAAPGRERVGFRTHTDVDGDVHVVPEDALPLLSTGRLDPRLFDVSGLVRAGYGDDARDDLPLIVDYPGATPRAAGARAVRPLPAIGAVAVRADKDTDFWADARTSADRIWLDGRVEATLEHSVPRIGAPAAWAAGHTGEGTTVAVLDSGVDTTHPDLADAVTGEQDFTGSASGPDDRFGHGTHVASIITGADETNTGVAPDTTLLNGKVLDDTGSGQESWIIAGMEWAATSGADVVNLSLGSQFPTDGTDPLARAVNRLTAETGVLFVAAAGNTGGTESIGSPGSADAALTVGAVDRDDQLADFSSRGPRLGDGAIKPDITAPGVGIVAAGATHGQIGDPAGEGHVSLSGTSMAAPHVAGAAAILAGQHPDWTADRLKSALMGSAEAHPDLSVFEQGAGRVDVAAAVESAVAASPASLSLGTVQWPHDDDRPITRTLTYTNAGTEPVTLDLAADLAGPDGATAPAGMFTFSADRVTVPAGGSTEVTLTTDTRVEAADGVWSGAVAATADGTVVRTPVAVTREVESYDVELTFLDHDGQPTEYFGARFVDVHHPRAFRPADGSGTVTARVPRGEYYFEAYVQTEAETRIWPLTDFVEPGLVVDGPAAYTLDARDGVAFGTVVDQPNAAPGVAILDYSMVTDWGDVGSVQFRADFHNVWSRPSSTTAPDRFSLTVDTQLAELDGTGELPGFHASPYLYTVRHTYDGAVPADLVQRFADDDLAKVESTYAVATPDNLGIRDGFLTMPLPYRLTEFYSPGVEWSRTFEEAESWLQFPRGGFVSSEASPRSFELGRTTKERWNVGVFGPGFAYNDAYPGYDIARLGDEFVFGVGLFADQNPRRYGGSGPATGSSVLLRDGEVVHEHPSPTNLFTVLPPEEATYTVRATATQPGPLSTRVEGEWTFTSGHVPGEAPKPVPALAVRFAPNLDDHNTAPAGERFRFPVYVQRNGAETPGRVTRPDVEVSYDDGQTWRTVRLTRHHGAWLASVHHPRDAEFVSLRWSVSDADGGNPARATILRAYALR